MNPALDYDFYAGVRPSMTLDPPTHVLQFRLLNVYMTTWAAELASVGKYGDAIGLLALLGVVIDRHSPPESAQAVINTLLRQFVMALANRVGAIARTQIVRIVGHVPALLKLH